MNRREHIKGLFSLAAASSLAACNTEPTQTASNEPVPPGGIGNRIKHVSYSDQGGRPDAVQVMVNRKHVYVGHMFSNGITVLDANDPRNLKPVTYWSLGQGDLTRTHQIQTANDLLIAANGANIVALQSYDNQRGYFENNLADSITKKGKFRSGISIHDISKPGELREIAFLEIPGLGVNRTHWTGGRYCYVSAHFEGFTDHILCVVDLNNITKPEVVSRWWLPGMNRAAGEKSTAPQGKRYALHHMLTSGELGLASWRDGGLTVHDLKDPRNPKFVSHINWSPPYPGGTHTSLPLNGRKLAVVADEANAEKCAKGLFTTFVLDMRAPQNPVPIATLPSPRDRDYCAAPGTFGPHNLHENRPNTFQSEDVIFATYNNAGVRVFDIKDQYAPKELAYWVPPAPKKMIDPRPKVTLAAKTADIYVMPDGLMYVTDWNAGLNVLQYEG
jgi:hypothetical protein